MNIKKNKYSISLKSLIYFVFFGVFILLIFWLFQTFYFNYSYENYQIKNINKIANSILGLNVNYIDQNLEKIAYNNQLCIEALWNNNSLTDYNTMLLGCGLGKNNL